MLTSGYPKPIHRCVHQHPYVHTHHTKERQEVRKTKIHSFKKILTFTQKINKMDYTSPVYKDRVNRNLVYDKMKLEDMWKLLLSKA